VPDQQPTDDEILALAQEIKGERGVTLVEAMDIAAHKHTNQGDEFDTRFEIVLELKPRVAKFFRENFSGHPTLTVEERLAAFLVMQLNRLRGEALARTRSEADIEEGQANTLRRSTFLEKAG